ncbi:hypothetical protein BVC93_17425 [Mycobacterium sp. MS1601]|uniref:hypothetical protein n=1 Tax=Mycobacterium sp. MS1601 TaxID=1936029 RepID=UPI0009795098|nr:hypothetical protein [Mycobacterium sp. MS1601]AQA03914.1 hypothetical protein BVC93_17425 [Mycobacterium sp. MS1601]
MTNELLLDIEVFPDYGQIEVSDIGGREGTQGPGREYGVSYSDHTVDVFTMSVEESLARDQDVRVRVFSGSDQSDLGTLVFDRNLIFSDPPKLGIYQPLADDPEDGGGSVSIERTGPVRIQIFVDPPHEADHVNILIRYDLPPFEIA